VVLDNTSDNGLPQRDCFILSPPRLGGSDTSKGLGVCVYPLSAPILLNTIF
jgi:hypothetical protein